MKMSFNNKHTITQFCYHPLVIGPSSLPHLSSIHNHYSHSQWQHHFLHPFIIDPSIINTSFIWDALYRTYPFAIRAEKDNACVQQFKHVFLNNFLHRWIKPSLGSMDLLFPSSRRILCMQYVRLISLISASIHPTPRMCFLRIFIKVDLDQGIMQLK